MPKVSVALDEQEHHTLMELAEGTGLSHSGVFRRLLERAQEDPSLLDAPEPLDLEGARAVLKSLGQANLLDRSEAWR
jgi:hypothetical protein